MRILSVDDNEDNLYLIKTAARALGHEVGSAFNGVEALELLAARGFDVIVSDVMMPGMDGFELCRRVKTDERLKHIPFVFYTATYTTKQDEDLGLSLGASRFIVKPADPEVLLAAVEQMVLQGENGRISVPEVDLDDGGKTLSLYNRRLVQKLERKLLQLEAARKELAASIEEKNREFAQRQMAEGALERSEEQLRLIWEGSMDGMRLTDHRGIVLRANPALARMFHKPLDGMSGRPFTDCYKIDDPESLLAGYREQLASRTVEARFETKLRRWDGEQIWVEGSNAVIELPSGPAVFTMFRDLT